MSHALGEGESAGIGLRHQHFTNFLADKPSVPWLEVHTENFLYSGSNASKNLDIIRQDYPISAHCVGMSLGTAANRAGLDCHLKKVKEAVDRIQPFMVSDHLAWSASANHVFAPDLLPLPLTKQALSVVVENVSRAQEVLQRQILIENPSTYMSFDSEQMPEWEFINQVCTISGCGLLLDINNVYVNATNHHFDPYTYIDNITHQHIGELHLAGHSEKNIQEQTILIDTHSKPVCEHVWRLFEYTLAKVGTLPTLVEWDNEVPDLSVLLAEREKAEALMSKVKNDG